MKKIILVFLLIVLNIHANHISWLGDYNKAHQYALKVNKPMMVLLVKKNSIKSNKIIIENFMNQPYIDKLNQKFVAIMVTYNSKISYPIELYYSTVFPTLFFVNSRDERFLYEPMYGDEIGKKLKKIPLLLK